MLPGNQKPGYNALLALFPSLKFKIILWLLFQHTVSGVNKNEKNHRDLSVINGHR